MLTARPTDCTPLPFEDLPLVLFIAQPDGEDATAISLVGPEVSGQINARRPFRQPELGLVDTSVFFAIAGSPPARLAVSVLTVGELRARRACPRTPAPSALAGSRRLRTWSRCNPLPSTTRSLMSGAALRLPSGKREA